MPPDGTYCYRVTSHYATDPDASATVTVVVDTTAPQVSITQPTASLVSGTIGVAATASDPGGSGVGTPALTFTGPVSGSLGGATWNTTTVPDGTYTIHADVTDAAGNPGSAIHPVTVDNTAPAKPQVHALQSPVAGSPTLTWVPVGGETYHVARTSSTGPGAKAFPGAAMPDWTDPDQLPPGTYTYVVTATDSAGNSAASATATVIVIPPGDTAPRSFTADSPTNAPPHLTWQPPVTFAVTSWQVYRGGQPIATLGAAASSFDDVGAPQGSNLYSVQAISSGVAGDMSGKVAVIYDTQAPTLGAVTATPNADGSVALTWPDAVDAGSGVASYVVRRGAQATAPGDPKAGTGVCAITLPAAPGCVDSATQSGSIYGYSVFAFDGAGNVTRQTVTARALDTVPPDPVTNFRASVGPTNAHLTWDPPAQHVSDVAGYRIIELINGAKLPTNPRDGTEVCPGLGFRANDCFVQNLSTGKKVTFAIYTLDDVPNFSAPVLLTVTPNTTDHTKPAVPTKVRVSRVGARITMRWVSPKNLDLSHFVVNLNKKGPAKNPGVRPIVFKGRKLIATFTLHPGQIAYANLFAVDLSGNFSRVTKRIVMPRVLSVGTHKKGAKTTPPKTTTPPKKDAPKKAPGSAVSKPPPVQVVIS